MATPIIDIKDLAHFRELIKSNRVVIIDAWASWSGSCRMMAPIYERYSIDQGKDGVLFAKVDVDSVGDVARELGVKAIPTFFSLYNGGLLESLPAANPNGLQDLVNRAASKV